MKIDTAVGILGALAHPHRLRVFRMLVAAGKNGMSAGALAKQLRVAPGTLSFHLKELAGVGLLAARPDAQFIFYSANFRLMNEFVEHLTENCCGGAACEIGAAGDSRQPVRKVA